MLTRYWTYWKGGFVINAVRCRDCANFIKDKIGFGMGLGECMEYEQYKAKNPGEGALRRALIQLPDYPLFWDGTEKTRKCSKYKPI